MRRVRLSAVALATVFALLDLATPVSAATTTQASTFSVTTTHGTKHSFVITGYEWGQGTAPKSGSSGVIEVDVLVGGAKGRAVLKAGKVSAAALHIHAVLPKKINTTYKFAGGHITSVNFVQASEGPAAVVDLSFKKVTT